MAAILAVGLALRVCSLGAKSLWFDEAVSASFLDFSYAEILARCSEARGLHPPVYFLLLRLWSTLWGDSEAALRSLAAVGGMATIVGVYLCVRELMRLPRAGPAPRTAALLAAALVALSPLQIHLSQQVRGYALATALVAWGGWLLLRGLRADRWRGAWWCVWSAFAAAACYTHHLALPSFAAQWLFAAISLRARAELGGPPHRAVARRWLAFAGAVFVLGYLLPWLPVLTSQSRTIRNSGQWPIRLTQVPDQVFKALYATPDGGPTGYLAVSCLALGLLAAFFIALAIFERERGWFLIFTGLIPPTLLIAYSMVSDRSIFHARYLCFAQLSWLAGAAVLVARMPFRAERLLLAAWLISMSAFACHGSWKVIGTTANPGVREAARFILRHRDPGEFIAVRTPYTFFGIAYYTRGQAQSRLCSSGGPRTEHYGGEHLRDSDLINVGELLATDAPGAWIVTSNSFHPKQIVRFEVPRHWELEGRWTFEQDHFLERPVIVEHYRIGHPTEASSLSGIKGLLGRPTIKAALGLAATLLPIPPIRHAGVAAAAWAPLLRVPSVSRCTGISALLGEFRGRWRSPLRQPRSTSGQRRTTPRKRRCSNGQ